MKDQALENTVVTLHARGRSIHSISAELTISRGRVRRILARNARLREHERNSIPKKNPGKSKLDDWKQYIGLFLEKHPKATGQRVFEHLQSKGYSGGITIVRDYLLSLRGRKKQKDPVVMVETSAGQRAAHDWSEYTVGFSRPNGIDKQKVIFFSYILAYSRRQYIEVVEDKTQTTLLRCLVHAFIYFDGVPREIKSDNQKPCVNRWEGGKPVFNERYLSFASHYRFHPLTIRPGHPQENLKIERPFYYLELSFLNGRTFKDPDDLKTQLKGWLSDVNDVRIHGTTRKRPIDMFAHEQPHLQPLPSQHYDTSQITQAVVNAESCIYYKGYQYVVPSRYMYELCTVRVTPDELMVYNLSGVHLVTHPLAEKGRTERYVGRTRTSRTSTELPIDQVQQRVESFGPQMEPYIEALKRHRSQSWRRDLRRLLALKANYHTRDIHYAIQRALSYKVFKYGAIERFLEQTAPLRHGIKLDPYCSQKKDTPHE